MRGIRTTVAAVAAVVVVGGFAGCGDDDRQAPPTPASDGASTASTDTDVDDVTKVAAIQVCRQVITSAGVMVRDYNTFMKMLNDTQSYDAIGSEDRWAVETLNTGADVVRKAISPAAPAELVDDVSAFVDSSEKLAERIERKQRGALNRAADEWDDKRTAALDRCGDYLPTE